MSSSKPDGCGEVGCALAVLAAVLLFFLTKAVIYRCDTEYVTAKVVKLEQVKNGDKGKYLVFTEGETFEITDSALWARWDSSDLYGRMQVGKTYRMRVAGWRWHVLSWYRNVITAEEVNSP